MIHAENIAPLRDFTDVKVGDRVKRLLGGEVAMYLTVTEVTDKHIVCGVPSLPNAEGWRFDRRTGIEEDTELGWGVQFGRTGSYLVKEQ